MNTLEELQICSSETTEKWLKMKIRLFTALLVLFVRLTCLSQQLIINEVSQGAAGAKEYVELLVTGTPICNSIPCMDLRNYIIDDNNGNHATGVGTGIAAGCVRLKNVTFWSCIPIGTMILIYNDADPNPLVPAIDLSMTDGNCKLVIPISDCTLLERHTTLPSTASSIYPSTGYVNCGNWSNISMANSDDSFQVISSGGGLLHSVSWGNNTISPIIYFSGGAGGMVAVMTNAVDNNPSNQTNWIMLPIAGNETPGSPNNALNSAWINSMNNFCTALLPFTGTASSSNPGCTCNGSATLLASGAIAPYTYTWLPTGGNANTASGLCAGVYTVSATSSNGCVQSLTVNIISAGTVSATVTSNSVTCNGLSNGSATVTPNWGTGPYTYTWSPTGGNGHIASSLSPGTYTVLVKDALNCTTSAVTIISQPSSALLAFNSATNILCFGSANGSASVTSSGGTAGYTYTWSPSGGNSSLASPLSPGNYTVLIKDANNCTVTVNASITQPTSITAVTSVTNILCFGSANGLAFVSASGGTAGYTYSWSPSGGNSSLTSPLSPGNYTVLIKDANNCTGTANANITQPIAPLNATIIYTNATCGMANGSASVTASGGTAGYSYTWSPSGGNTAFATNLTAGNYNVLVKDANNCQFNQTVTIIQPSSITFTVTKANVSCFGGSNGSSSIAVNGGTAPYSYTWSPAPGAGQGSAVASGLSSQIYTISVADNLGCTSFSNVLITQPASSVSAVTSVTNILCFGSANGSASVTSSGGTAGYTYTWSPSGGNTSSASPLSPGNYTVLIKDANNCTVTANASVTQPVSPLTAVTSVTNILCFGSANGSASVTSSGGTAGYTYTWSPSGGNTSSASALSPGNYTVLIKDANNCTVTANAIITQPASALTATITNNNVLCNGGSNGSATITASGGTPGYIYHWASSSITASVNTELSAGSHSVFILDANNCFFSLATNITQPPALTLSVNAIKLCNGQNGVLTGNVSGGTGPYSYFWNNNPGGSTITVSATASVIYTLSVVDANGCNSPIDTAMVNVSSPLTVSMSPSKTICSGSSANLTASALGGSGTYQFIWLPGSLSGQNISVSANNTTIYTVSITDGCSQPAVLTTTIYVESIVTPTLIADKYSGCTPVCVNFTNTTLTSPSNIQSTLWTFGDGSTSTLFQPQHCYDKQGVYFAYNSFTTNAGCIITIALKNPIKVFQKPYADFTADKYTVEDSDPTINFYNHSSAATYYYWDFGNLGSSTSVKPSFNFNQPGKYLISLIAMNGLCADTAFRFIECLPLFTFYAPNVFTPNENNLNDSFLPKGEGWNINTYNLMIFDRWGEQIFHTNKYNEGWDGKCKGEIVQDDSYIWKVNLKDIFGKQHYYVGHVVVIK
ncbi:MAG: gliding motility-associated C-terminal domain-containing protein [Bacteroidetes bacterium]|nr:gliding motility-associated C-terminal domain-containing protein [Bacteroidota bacterium]